VAAGKRLRAHCPRASHANWRAGPGRPDPVSLVTLADKGRLPELLALRHGRMARSPFTFYRGSALAMATDLARTPTSGIRVQCCGDAHLSNFGGFATPERRVIFSINDLDETLPGPFEWDVKRLAASFTVASRNNGLTESAAKDATQACVRSYRESMAEFSEMRMMELWYLVLTVESMIASVPDPAFRRRALKRLRKESGKSVAEDIFPKLAGSAGRQHHIKDQLPTIFHLAGYPPGRIEAALQATFARYRGTLTPSVQTVLDRFEIQDAAIKVVGVGSVGTRCWVLLLMAGEDDPLFLQIKEARRSVLEPFAGKSAYANHGQRVVNGQRLMQPYSDIFLGWTTGELGVHYYFRQLRDIKLSILVETFDRALMTLYAKWAGRALALAHARSGDAATITGYLGKGDTFDRAIAGFSGTYADQNERDHARFIRAIRKGTISADMDAE